MGKSIFQDYRGKAPQNTNAPRNFDEFVKNFKGNPTEELQKLRSSGQMPPQLYNALAAMANNIIKSYKK
jgi:hypothetical protein